MFPLIESVIGALSQRRNTSVKRLFVAEFRILERAWLTRLSLKRDTVLTR